jgi:hypothetical protein
MKRSSAPRSVANLSESVQHRLNMYALVATTAGVGVLASPQSAEAKIVYTPANITISPNTTFPLDLNHDGFNDFSIVNTSYGNAHSFQAYLSVRQLWSQNRVWGSHYASALRAGVLIGPVGRFTNGNYKRMGGYFISSNNQTGYFGPWANGGKGVRNRYLGLKFIKPGKSKVYFGWARLTVSTKKPHIFAKLTGYAYETIPGKAIIAGKTKGPDVSTVNPASLGHLAAGASAIPAWRSGR